MRKLIILALVALCFAACGIQKPLTEAQYAQSVQKDLPFAVSEFKQAKPELTVLRMTFPVGAVTGWHHHTAVNYGIVEQGELTIVCQDGKERTFHEAEALVEVVGTIHRGENRGTKPVILNMFYFAEPGQELTIQHPEITCCKFGGCR